MPRVYGSIPHLPGSRAGSDRTLAPGQAARFLEPSSVRKNEEVIVQEKLDGSCVVVRREGGKLVALGREGKLASESRNEGRRMFAVWVERHHDLLATLVAGGETLAGEWLALVHGTRYELAHPPFVPFDVLVNGARLRVDELARRLEGTPLVMPAVIHRGPPLAIADAVRALGPRGRHGAIDAPEGLVYRVERARDVLVAKWVDPQKVDGRWLPEATGGPALYHWRP